MRRRGRLITIALLVLALIAVALALTVRSLLAPERFTRIVTDGVAKAGLTLHLAIPAHAALWPRPAVELDGVRLVDPASGDTLLTARQLRLVVPWRGLSGEGTQIERLEIDAPELDLGVLKSWLDARPSGGGEPALPAIDTGVHVNDGRLLDGGKLLLAKISLDTGALRAGTDFEASLDAIDAHARPVSLDLEARPRQAAGVVLDPLHIALSRGADKLTLGGRVAWHGGARINGEIAGEIDFDGQTRRLSLARAAGAPVAVKLAGDDGRLKLMLAPDEVWRWWQSTFGDEPGAFALPPVAGSVAAPAVSVAGWKISGLTITSGPAVATSAATAASVVTPP